MASFVHRPSTARLVRRQVVAAAAAAAMLAALVAILSNGSTARVTSASTASQGAATTVDSFARALTARDYKKICNDLFSADARAAEGGSDCPSLLATNSVLLQHPHVRLGSVSLHGSGATASVSVTQDHQPRMIEILQLVRERGSYKISAVNSPGE